MNKHNISKFFITARICLLFIFSILIQIHSSVLGQNPAPRSLGLRWIPPEDYPEKLVRRKLALLEALPTSYDARSRGIVTPAKDQGDCGSCWAFASAGALESHILATNPGGQLDISEQQLVSCDRSNYGCNGGYLSSIGFWMKNAPVMESCFPYTSTDSTPCVENCTSLPYRVLDWHILPTDPASLKASCYGDGPAPFAFAVYSDFYNFWDSAGPGSVYQNTQSHLLGGHAVILIGWDDNRGAFLCKNSWGRNGGPNGDGTFWIAYSGHRNNISFQAVNFEIGRLGEPTVTGFKIAGGASVSANRLVRLSISSSGEPTHYMASESASFEGASWQPYSESPQFYLSEGRDTKKIFLKLANATGQSRVVYDTILLRQVPSIVRFVLDSGNGISTDRKVTINSTCTGSPTQFLVSEDPSFKGAPWQVYTNIGSLVLSTGSEMKRVYFKVRSRDGESPVRSDSIRYVPLPKVTSFFINQKNSTTADRRITLQTICTGTPSSYIASESPSFQGAVWQKYIASPRFLLSTGGGLKRIYLKVRNDGGESSVVSDTIRLR